MKSSEPTAERLAGIWWALGLLLVLMLPTQLWLGEPIWMGGPERLFQFLVLGGAYVLATMTALILWRRFGSVVLSTLVGAVVAFGVVGAILVVWLEIGVAKGVAGLAFGLSLGLIGSGLLLSRGALRIASVVSLAAVAVLFIWGRASSREPQPAFETVFRSLAYHRVRVDYHNDVVAQDDERRGGGFQPVGDAYVRMTGSGKFFRIGPTVNIDSIVSEPLPLPSPLNMATFDSAGGPRRQTFRALDFTSRRVGAGHQMLASHHYYHSEGSCIVVRISALQVDQNLRPVGAGAPAWEPLYETEPCLALADEASRRPAGIQLESGGRLDWLTPDQLLITVGDHGFDGWNHPFIAAQADSSDYGRTLVLDLTTGSVETFTRGQRNPQGLHVDGQGRIWSTEHGPQGGDELNLLVRGRNYGWPYETAGTDYGRRVWPLLDEDRGEFEEPVLAWVPSIGVSELMSVPPGPFSRWVGDLLVASLREQTLYRVALSGDRVVYTEPVPIGRRVRDIVSGPDGSVWLWTDTGDLVTLSVVSTGDQGEELFGQCASCHLTEYNDASGGIAPSLRGVVGREVASMPDFDYSAGLRALGGTWTAERLDQFLQDPDALAPGTSMVFPGVPDSAERAALIAYLREIR